MIGICREYIVGLMMEQKRKSLPKETIADKVRICEMAAYLTHCKWENKHLMLALRTAQTLSYKLGNFKVSNITGLFHFVISPEAFHLNNCTKCHTFLFKGYKITRNRRTALLVTEKCQIECTFEV